MGYPKYGDYQAVVTDNSEFYKRGYIRVRISAFYSGNLEWDLSQNYNDEKFKSSLKDDIKCLVFMPLGGGNGHGMFSLPQVNSIGIVSFIDGNINKALWKGSFVNPKYDENGKFYNANVPNDKLEYEGPGAEGITVDGKQVDVEGSDIIIRQKSTKSGSAESMKWDKNRTENLVIIGKNKLSLTHASEWKEEEDGIISPMKYQEISILTDSDESSITFGATSISIKEVEVTDDGNINEYGLTIADKKITLKTSIPESKMENKVEIDGDEVLLTSIDTNTKKTSSASVSPTEVELKTKNSSVKVSEDEINVSSKNLVTLSAKEVRLGGTSEEYVVTSPVAFVAARMEDGHVLGTSFIAKA